MVDYCYREGRNRPSKSQEGFRIGRKGVDGKGFGSERVRVRGGTQILTLFWSSTWLMHGLERVSVRGAPSFLTPKSNIF